MSSHPIVVSPRSRQSIEDYALSLRRAFGIPDDQAVNMLRLIELVLPEVLPGFEYEIVDDKDLGDAEATTSMTSRTMKISLTCYRAAFDGVSRYAFTLAHELGHLLLHTGRPAALARGQAIKPYVNAEWQADAFAGAFLMPACTVRQCRSIAEITQKFGVSPKAAAVRAKILNFVVPDGGSSAIRKGRKPMTRTP